jgi:4-azaleucine resistance transporter AzlC
MKKPSALYAALPRTIPVFFGYISIGIAYGFLLVKTGLPWFWAPIMSIVIFAGAAQFLALGLLSAGTPPLQMALAVFLLNARHMVYGFSLLDRYSRFKRWKLYLIFGLTDETYALLTTIDPPEGVDPENFDAAVTMLNQLWWTLGSTIGALFGSVIGWDAPGLDFALTALFVVLLVEQVKSIRRPGPFLIALSVSAGLMILGFGESILLVGIIVASGAVFFLKEQKGKA